MFGPCCRAGGVPLGDAGPSSAREWGRAQAALAPPWSVSKRRRIARSFGVVLREESADPGEGCSEESEQAAGSEQRQHGST